MGLAVILSLAGCSAAPSAAPTTAPDSSSTDQSGADDTGVEGYEGLPDTFPSDVPIIEGDVVFGVDLGTGWSIVIPRDDIDGGYRDAEALITGAGYTAGVSSTTAEGSFGSFDNDKYTVQITATDSADYGPSVQYVVIKKG